VPFPPILQPGENVGWDAVALVPVLRLYRYLSILSTDLRRNDVRPIGL
jgi:hypothetical protein